LSCCASEACKCCVQKGCRKSVATRLGYAVMLLLVTVLSWFLQNLPIWTDGHFFLIHIPVLQTCLKEDSVCYGAMAVYRFCFALTLFHLFFAVMMIGVKSSRDCRAGIQDGFWFFKLLGVVGVIVATFFIPNGFFIPYAWASIFGAGLFIIVQLILLVDFAHTWNESWVGKYEESEGKKWAVLLSISTLTMYLVSLVSTILLFVFFTKNAEHQCWMNPMAISLNLIFCIAITVFSIHPRLQEKNPRAGLLQSAVVTMYCTYLVWSAIMSEPVDMKCGSISMAGGTHYSVILGVIITVIAVIYSTLRLSTSSENLMGREEVRKALLPEEDPEDSAPVLAVQGTEGSNDDEATETTYNYTFFHISFALAAMYLAMVITNWQTVSKTNQNQQNGIQVDQGMISVWVKLVSGWITIGLYGWTLLAPVLFPDRQFVATA